MVQISLKPFKPMDSEYENPSDCTDLSAAFLPVNLIPYT